MNRIWNLKIRRQNIVFIAQVILSFLIPVLAYYGLKAEDITSWNRLLTIFLDAIKNPYVLTMAIVSVWNALTDPTTKGAKDNEKVLNATELIK